MGISVYKSGLVTLALLSIVQSVQAKQPLKQAKQPLKRPRIKLKCDRCQSEIILFYGGPEQFQPYAHLLCSHCAPKIYAKCNPFYLPTAESRPVRAAPD